MPAKPVPEGGSRASGIQSSENCLDSRLRGNDGCRRMKFYATLGLNGMIWFFRLPDPAMQGVARPE